MLKNKTILISGGAGSIGSELVRQLSGHNTVIAADQDETGVFDLANECRNVIPEIVNIRNFNRMAEVFDRHRPDIVFHCAAYKHLSRFEGIHYDELIETNINGTINIIKLCKKFGAKFIFISTDKAVNPTSLMGATKLIGEIITKRNGFVAVRFGNVMGSRGSVIPIWQKQMERGESLTVTDEKMERYFMTIPEACSLVIKASEIGKPGQVIILDMGKQVKLIDLARKIIEDARSSSEIKIIGAKEGEKLSEELMTDYEKSIAIKKDKFFVI